MKLAELTTMLAAVQDKFGGDTDVLLIDANTTWVLRPKAKDFTVKDLRSGGKALVLDIDDPYSDAICRGSEIFK